MTTSRRSLVAVGMVYILLVLTLSYFHEPWRDEVEMWLMARDASLSQLLALAPNMGTPLLWPMLLMPLAKAGLPIESMQLVQVAIAGGFTLLLLCFAPLPLPWKLLIISGYYFSFEYGVVARNYSLGVLLLFAIACLDSRRTTAPWRYGALVFLLAHTSVHFWFISAVLTALAFAEVLQQRQRALLPVVLLGGIASILNLMVLYPTGGGQFTGLFVSTFRPEAAIAALEGAIFPRLNSPLLLVLAAMCWLSFILLLMSRPRAAAIAYLSLASLLYIFCFKHVGGSWHFGLLLIVLLFALWLQRSEPVSPRVPAFLRKLSLTAERLFSFLFCGSLIIGLVPQLQLFWIEYSLPHSQAKAMAGRLDEAGYADQLIAAHPAPVSAALLGYLPETKFWYASRREFGTYMQWDATHARDRFIEDAEVFRRVKSTFPQWHSEERPVLVLLNHPLDAPQQYGYRLVLELAQVPWRIKDERYFLYAPLTGVAEEGGLGAAGSGIE